MSDKVMVAVPSEAPGGLEAKPSAHFGHCAAYTVAVVENGQLGEVKVVPNPGHEHGGCVKPVEDLAGMGVTALIAGGMGQKPLEKMNELGITVFYSAGASSVGAALDDFAAGRLQKFGADRLCKGCGGHKHL